jgi:hypothetical protein
MNRSVYYGGEQRRQFLNSFFELADSAKAIAVGNVVKDSQLLKIPKRRERDKRNSQSSLEEYDIYGTNSSRENEPSVHNEFEVDLEENKKDQDNEQKVDEETNENQNLEKLEENEKTSNLDPRENLIKVRNSYVFGRDIPNVNDFKETAELQCIKEFENKKETPKEEIESMFGLCHCPGKNHVKKTGKKLKTSKTLSTYNI